METMENPKPEQPQVRKKLKLIAVGVLTLLIIGGIVLMIINKGDGNGGGGDDSSPSVTSFLPIWVAVFVPMLAKRNKDDKREYTKREKSLLIALVVITVLAVIATIFGIFWL